ncbi:histidine kinase [Massilia sp. Root351]|jgi:PAS domain S-box-containing protein|uniref:response regulator n=1 Tax=Massilia sp. Root351 TaxID=1736522 RepID=UPI00070CD05D|nr:response regulator [Massilia sp. Root351]KQV82458.1 histidine kinase [Massilia sp. Root351]
MIEASAILNASILIVDDQEANVMLLEQMLDNAGYQRVTSCTDPFAVRALHLEHSYDLILLDLQMPGLDGFGVMAGLQDIEPDSYVPVLVVTAQPDHKLRALQAGARDFVSKPYELVELQTRIRNMLELRLLHQRLNRYNQQLEFTVLERTAELRASEARFQRFTELSSDWYWEQDAEGALACSSGGAAGMLGLEQAPGQPVGDWNAAERAALEANIAERKPFLDLICSRTTARGAMQYVEVSGEPMFDGGGRFSGYRGVGRDITHLLSALPQRAAPAP